MDVNRDAELRAKVDDLAARVAQLERLVRAVLDTGVAPAVDRVR